VVGHRDAAGSLGPCGAVIATELRFGLDVSAAMQCVYGSHAALEELDEQV